MASTGRVICVGHAAFDSVYRIEAFPERPTKVKASRHDRSVGGMAANAACAVAALGGHVSLWGPIGDDEIGGLITDELRRAGVVADLGFIVPGARSSHSAIIVESNGERLIVSYRGNVLEAPSGLVEERPLEADVVMIDVRWPAGALCVAARARALGIPVVIDAEMGDVDLVRALVPMADHVIFSEPGWTEWLGHAPDQAETRRTLLALVDAGAAVAAVTMGERGVMYAGSAVALPGRGGVAHLPAFAVTAVETLGAGDTFHGAYALALAEGVGVEEALRFASAAAALRCSRSGGRAALPSRQEVLALLAR
ncbi:MAG TPA: PfkB family carbohydrate kinase [Lautropia sp.]|nr:PfkB family carbohydrate kinase [Lautropia sp.]